MIFVTIVVVSHSYCCVFYWYVRIHHETRLFLNHISCVSLPVVCVSFVSLVVLIYYLFCLLRARVSQLVLLPVNFVLACDLLANHSSAPPCRSPRVSVLPLVIFLPAALLQLCCTFLNFCFYWMLLVFSGLSFPFCLDLKSTCQLFFFPPLFSHKSISRCCLILIS